MFRARQLSSLLTNFPAKTLAVRYLVENKSVLLSKSLVSSRFYSSKDDGVKKVSDSHDEKPYPPPPDLPFPDSVHLKECQAVDVNPYYPTRPLDTSGKIPSIQECPDSSNMMSELPCPKPTFDEHNKNARNQYKKVLLFSLLFTAVTLAAAYKVIWTTNTPKKPPAQEVSNKEKKKKG